MNSTFKLILEKIRKANIKRETIWISLLLFLVAIISLYEITMKGLVIFKWDLMLLSGLLVLSLGIKLSAGIPNRINTIIANLQISGIIHMSFSEMNQLNDKLEERSKRWAGNVSFALVLILVTAACFTFRLPYPMEKIPLLFVLVIGGAIAGRYLGRIASYGFLIHFLRKSRVEYQVEPSHPDRVNGLKSIGRFYFYQAMVTAIPALFIGIWIWIIPVYPNIGRYDYWLVPYMFLLIVALALEVIAFLVPLLVFHSELKRQKTELLKGAAELSRNIVELKRKMVDTSDSSEFEALKEQLDYRVQYYKAIESMSTWPLDVKTGLRFTINNTLLVLPLIKEGLALVGII